MTCSIHSVENSYTQTTTSGSFMQVYVEEYQIKNTSHIMYNQLFPSMTVLFP